VSAAEAVLVNLGCTAMCALVMANAVKHRERVAAICAGVALAFTFAATLLAAAWAMEPKF